MHKLLVPVDTSQCSIRALAHAIRLAKDNGPMALHIVYSHEEPDVAGKVQVYMSEERAAELQKRHSEDILGPAIAAAKAAGVAFESEILIGETAPSIVACAERQGCDGIVMGTQGMSAVANALLGSVATSVVHLTKLPVTLVK